MFEKLSELISELKDTSSSNEKVDILKNYLENDEQLKKIFYYVHHPLYQFYVSSANCKKNKGLKNKRHNCIFALLDDLRTRKITGHDAISAINGFLEGSEYVDLVHNILDKDLKIRAGDKLVNKAIPDLIPEFEVALAEKYSPDIVSFEDDWHSSRKLDGCRCICIVDDAGGVTSISRQGKIFSTLGVIESAIKDLNLKSVVFDGEVCLIDNKGNESFQGIMKLIRKKDYQIETPVYKIFDLITSEEFYSKKSKRILSERLKELESVMKDNSNSCLSILEQTKIKNSQHFEELTKEATENGWEGLILRKDTGYAGKRSKDLLKYKNFFDAEYVVNDVEFGPFRYVFENKEKEETMLSCVMIEHKNNIVRVGSGFTIEQRKYYHENPSDLLGKTILVQYFEETENEKGGISLRFPVVKFIYDNGRDT
jgi:DNA ligase 1